MEYYDIFLSVFNSAIRLSIPLIFTALAGLFSERAGILDIGLEGKMLASAFAAACVAAISGSAWVGLLGGVAASMGLSLIHGFASITHRGNQIISGFAINFFVAGITVVLGQAWFEQGGRTPLLGNEARFSPLTLPAVESIGSIPLIGSLYARVISGHNILTYLAILSVPVSWWVLYRTRFGLRLRAVGENPAAVDTAGISVAFLRYRAVLCAGLLCGFSGTYLVVAQSASFVNNMSAGKGYIALAALIFAKWRPISVMFVCLLFGLLDAIGNFMQGKEIAIIGEVPVQIFQALPYILTCILLAGFIGAAFPPKAGGIPYIKER